MLADMKLAASAINCPASTLVAFGDLRYGRRADMLCQRNPHFVGSAKRSTATARDNLLSDG